MAPARESVTVTDDGIRLVGILERPSAEPGPLVLVLHYFLRFDLSIYRSAA